MTQTEINQLFVKNIQVLTHMLRVEAKVRGDFDSASIYDDVFSDMAKIQLAIREGKIE